MTRKTFNGLTKIQVEMLKLVKYNSGNKTTWYGDKLWNAKRDVPRKPQHFARSATIVLNNLERKKLVSYGLDGVWGKKMFLRWYITTEGKRAVMTVHEVAQAINEGQYVGLDVTLDGKPATVHATVVDGSLKIKELPP